MKKCGEGGGGKKCGHIEHVGDSREKTRLSPCLSLWTSLWWWLAQPGGAGAINDSELDSPGLVELLSQKRVSYFNICFLYKCRGNLVSSFGSLEQMVVRFFVLFLHKTPDFILMI